MLRTLVLIPALLIMMLIPECAHAQPSGKKYGLTVDDALSAIGSGEARAAIEFYRRAGAEAEARGAKADAAQAYALVTLIASRQGAFQQAIRSGVKAFELLKDVPLSADVFSTRMQLYNFVSRTYQLAGDLDEARRYLVEALDMARQLADARQSARLTASFLRHLADIALEQGTYAEALRLAQEAVRGLEDSLREIDRGISMGRRAGGPDLVARREYTRYWLTHATLIVGRAQTSLGNLGDAETALNRALSLAKAYDAGGSEMAALTSLGDLSLAKKDYPAALRHLGGALGQATKVGAVPTMIAAHQTIGRVHAAQGQTTEALASIRQAIQLIEDVRSQLQESGLRSGFLENKQHIYEQAVALSLTAGKPDDAFGFAEGSRARAFLDLLGNQTTLSKGKTRQLVAEETTLRAQLAAAESATQDAGDEKARAAARQKVEAAAKEYRAFLERVKKESVEQASMMTVEPVTIQEVQRLLPAGTTLLEYLVAETEVVVWVIDAQSSKVIRIPGDRASLVNDVREYRKAIAEQAPLPQIEEGSRKLYDRLLATVRPEIRGDRVLIVPHDVLHYLPFAALRTPDGHWLVDDFALGTLPSASVLKYLAGKGTQASTQVLAVGNPDLGPALALPYAEREARLVSQRYPGATMLTRQAATEAKVKATSPGAGLIHFATHGELSESDPMASALLLVAGDGDDGRLEVRELFGLELNARLVVLSACETGLGKLSRGDELVGLQRAFLYAGTPALITTLWKIDDRASYLLMETFYDQLKTKEPAQALREAQRAATKQFPHPFSWAAFGLTGIPR
jgi:CHAT domain-containing protein